MGRRREEIGAGHGQGCRSAIAGWSGLLLGGLLAVAGCVTSRETALAPAPGHALVAGSSLAVEGRGGVSITADGNAWQGWPQDLPTVLTPVWVTVQNATNQPVQIRYSDFKLYGQSGAAYQALEPYTAETPGRRQTAVVPNPGYFEGFYVADYLAPYYPWLPTWGRPLTYEPSHQPVAWQPPMPTASMINQALPEGVLKPGGRASGFIYFQKVRNHEHAVTLRADLGAIPRGHEQPQRLAIIDIPFRVTR